jgi:hypothetical protein
MTLLRLLVRLAAASEEILEAGGSDVSGGAA